MNYHDQHLHTYFSFDADETFENYLKYQPEYFVSTEHFDLKNPAENFQDSIPDYNLYTKKISELEQSFPTKFLKGIELGIVPGQEQEIIDYLSTRPYDLKLLSIHQNGTFDYMDDIVLSKDKIAVTTEYFEAMTHVLTNFHEADILAHFDYGIRRFDFTVKEFAEHFEDQLSTVFKKVIEKEMALELNSKSFVKYQKESLYDYAIALYQNLGGKYFSLGSDAHQAADYQLAFEEMSAKLKAHHVKSLTLFIGKERVQIPL
ncbi:PHP domain-containing protein [Vagococcus elongatus]|uniref:Histidinol-phosphatase n=1 Tax=Vagococcus elongatus TaxID=180344 RepID=A0A430AMU7_9ENTE|nr:PHP domain-containing protein [Vagococcus elongatus]RSU09441.1 histidinol phosphate phosphatase [Vagococcus elongatus]